MSNLQLRAASWEAGSEGKIVGYAVVFEQRTVLYTDPVTNFEYGEIIDRNALDGADLSDVILRYNHGGRCLARTRNQTLQLTIDDHGLRIEADMTKSEEARSFYEDVKSGLIDKMSFAFEIQESEWNPDTRTSRVTKISRLLDVSLVDFPAYNQTQVSARGSFEAFAEPERRAYQVAQVSEIHAEMRSRIAEAAPGKADSYRSREEQSQRGGWRIPGLFSSDGEIDEAEAIRHDIASLGAALDQARGSADVEAAQQLRSRLDALEGQLLEAVEAKQQLRHKVASGTTGTPITFFQKKENKTMNTETREFYQQFVDARAAGTTGTMTKMIPATVMDRYAIEEAPGAFYAAASKTTISHAGNLTMPIATLQVVEKHEENAEIADAGYVPGAITINHAEYCYKSGYSDLGMTIGAANLEEIVKTTCVRSMLKKMDGICIDAAAALEYTGGTNAVVIASGTTPAFSDFVKLAGMLGADFLPAAKWRVNPSTYFTWLLGLKDDNGRPILDPSKLVSDQALGGYGIELDSQLPSGVVYFGDGSRVHLNYAREPELISWTDNDHNTQKVSVRTVSGATAEPGCMVKMYSE